MIFEDPTGHRWKMTLATFASAVFMAISLVVLFVGSMFSHPPLPEIQSDDFDLLSPVALDKPKHVASAATTTVSGLRLDQVSSSLSHLALPSSVFVSSTPDIRRLSKGPFLTAGFLVQENEESVESFKKNSERMDVVFPDWYAITQTKCTAAENLKEPVTPMLRGANVKIVPRVTNTVAGVVYGREARNMVRRSDMRSCLAKHLSERALTLKVEGLHVDLQGLDETDRDGYMRFITDLARRLHDEKLVLMVTLPRDMAPANLRSLSSAADAVIYHPPPGDLSSFQTGLAAVARTFSPQKILVVFDVYAFDRAGALQPPAAYRKFADVTALAKNVGALPTLDAASGEMEFRYLDERRIEHRVAFSNGVTIWNRWLYARQNAVLGFGVAELGNEDPSIWSFINKPEAAAWSAATVPALDTISSFDAGEIFRVSSLPQPGEISLQLDENGYITSARYTELPTGHILEKVGPAIESKQLVLTFSGGPDPAWTPQILDILEKYNVPAVFFVLGRNARRYPDLMREIALRGHLVGNHTYSQTNLDTLSGQRIQLEVNATQRLIESSFDRKTVLFRLPLEPNGQPLGPKKLDMLYALNAMGYLLVGGRIDSGDWMRPGVEEIVVRVAREAEGGRNHIILMHDSGLDRTQTVEALERLIPNMRTQGYEFVSLDQAMKLTPESLNPPLARNENILGKLPEAVMVVRGGAWRVISWLFIFTLGLSVMRILVLGTLTVISAFRHRQRFRGDPSSTFVSIVVPAFNEEKTITKTVRSVQGSRHTHYELLIVNDGSTDKTAEVAQALAVEDPRIRVISKPNGGKSSALNMGFQEARGEVVVTIDADTVLYPNTLTELIRPFLTLGIDAVCGNVEVGNVVNLLTGFQALEYITTQNFDRRAFDELNCISVVPGATGAWRRRKVLELGGYDNDTLTEDADITLRLLRAGGRIVYVPAARSRTEAPETIHALARQRFRWSFGTFQCMWKHLGAFFRGPLGWVALPNMFLFQILFPILSPIGDAVFLLMVLRGDAKPILVGYILFLIMDLTGSLLAFSLEHRPKKLMLLTLIQRFFYRQFMYVITFQSLFAILRGGRYGWNKLKRLGSVKTVFAAQKNPGP